MPECFVHKGQGCLGCRLDEVEKRIKAEVLKDWGQEINELTEALEETQADVLELNRARMDQENIDWCVIEGGDMVCKRCGGKHDFSLPVPVSVFVGSVAGFIGEHRDCVEVEG